MRTALKHISEFMREEPSDEEREALSYVIEAARAWKAGDLTLDGVRGYCSGLDRNRAMRGAEMASDDKKLLIALTDALVYQDDSRRGFMSKHGHISHEEMNQGAAQFTNWEGKVVWVWPLFWMNGQPHYPPVHIEPGEKRREEEAAMSARYSAYRKAKGRLG
jgi:hypothetical protein